MFSCTFFQPGLKNAQDTSHCFQVSGFDRQVRIIVITWISG